MSYPKITNTKVLVTGGAGFIGSNLCEDLLKTNNQVICLLNFIKNLQKLNALANSEKRPIKILRKKSYASKALFVRGRFSPLAKRLNRQIEVK